MTEKYTQKTRGQPESLLHQLGTSCELTWNVGSDNTGHSHITRHDVEGTVVHGKGEGCSSSGDGSGFVGDGSRVDDGTVDDVVS